MAQSRQLDTHSHDNLIISCLCMLTLCIYNNDMFTEVYISRFNRFYTERKC